MGCLGWDGWRESSRAWSAITGRISRRFSRRSRGGFTDCRADGRVRFGRRSGRAQSGTFSAVDRYQRAVGKDSTSIRDPCCTMTVCEPDGLGTLPVGGETNFGSATGISLGIGAANCWTNCGTITTSSGSTQSPHGPQATNGCRTKPWGAWNRDRIPGLIAMTPWLWNPRCPLNPPRNPWPPP